MKLITWIDLQGRYRVTSPAYDDPTRPPEETEDECIERVWAKLVTAGGYGIPANHPKFYVEDVDQRARLIECCGNYFRYAGKPDFGGQRSAIDGAWEMDPDGHPKINMTKARQVQMDYIRQDRDAELERLDILALRSQDVLEQQQISTSKQRLRDIPQAFDLNGYTTPKALRAAWPGGLPRRMSET